MKLQPGMQISELSMHQNPFGGRAPPDPLGGWLTALQTTYSWIFRRRGVKEEGRGKR